MKRGDIVEAVKRIIQTPQSDGVQVLLTDPTDYNLAIDQAVVKFGIDYPNTSVLDLSIVTAGWRFVVAGGGTPLIPTWVDGVSYVSRVWSPWSPSIQGLESNDANNWRIVADPGGLTVLELLDHTAAAGSLVRVEVARPWAVADTDADTTIPAGKARPFELLAAYFALLMAANAAVRNTGSTGLPGDIVDRRSQSDQYASRAKELLKVYGTLMGFGDGSSGTGAGTGAGSGFKDLDVRSNNPTGFLWHGIGSR